MEMKSAVPFLAMVFVQFAQVALMVVSKKAISSGITNFAFVFYSNAIDLLILLLPFSFTTNNCRMVREDMAFMFLGDSFYFGSLVGSIVIVIGFYSVMVEINLESQPKFAQRKGSLSCKTLLKLEQYNEREHKFFLLPKVNVREAQMAQYNYILVVGEEEANTGKINVSEVQGRAFS